MKKLFIAALALLIVFTAGVIIVWNHFNTLVTPRVERLLSDALQVEVKIGAIDLSADGGAQVRDLTIGNPEGFKAPYSIQTQNIDVQMDLKALSGGEIHFSKIELKDLYLTLDYKLGKTNFGQIIDDAEASEQKQVEEQAPESSMPVIIDELILTGARAQITAPMLKEPVGVALPKIEIRDLGKEKKDLTISRAMRVFLTRLASETAAIAGDRIPKELQKAVSGLADALNASMKQLNQTLNQAEEGLSGAGEKIMEGASEVKQEIGDLFDQSDKEDEHK
ncbi:AsmA family protein [Candidatus Sumerlaeota bacterium]|nr:AsmA family protein [Candidatus Sumerlaeota bacterium]